MDSKQQGRYFFIDTNPSNQHLPTQDNKSYDSDIIDEEIEHRLYSLVHHSSEAAPNDHTPRVVNTKSVVNPGNSVKKQVTNDTGSFAAKKRKTSNVSKKVEPITPSTSSSSTANTEVQGDNFSSTIYLSDSDDNGDVEVKIAEGKKNLWHVDTKDYMIHHPLEGYLYRNKIWCSRCRKDGNHPVKLCHLPKHKICYICGEIGHLGAFCENQHCTRCMDFHPSSKCSIDVRDFQCRICSKYGHLDDNCPNHWRKFHNITDPKVDPDTANNKILKNKKKSCSICGRHQHYSFECDRLRQRNIEISSPYDVNTTFGGNFHPNKTKSHGSHQPFQQSSGPKYRRPRYFNPKNQDVALDSGSTPQMSTKNNRKKSRSERRNKKKKAGRQLDDSVQIIKGPSIRSGRVEKNKARHQHKRRNRKAGKNSKPQHFDAMNLGNSNFMIGFRR